MNTKSPNWLHVVSLCFLAANALWLAGCASRGYDKSQAAAWSLQIAGEEVQIERRALESALSSLNDLVNKPPGDLIAGYQRFSASVDQLAVAARRNEAAARRVSQSSAAYFQNWDRDLATMNFDAVRGQSQARKAEVVNHFDTIKRRYADAQSTMQPLIAYLQDIRRALGTDLPLAGLEALKPAVDNANANGAKVQGALTNLAGELSNSGAKMSSVAVQNTQ